MQTPTTLKQQIYAAPQQFAYRVKSNCVVYLEQSTSCIERVIQSRKSEKKECILKQLNGWSCAVWS